MVSVFLDLLRFYLWPDMWSILENVKGADENNVCFVTVGQNVLQMCIRSICFIVCFSCNTPLLIFCLHYLSLDENLVLKSCTTIVLESVFPIKYSLYISMWSCVQCIFISNCYSFFLYWAFIKIQCPSSSLFTVFDLESVLSILRTAIIWLLDFAFHSPGISFSNPSLSACMNLCKVSFR